jgi:hypothetical protein
MESRRMFPYLTGDERCTAVPSQPAHRHISGDLATNDVGGRKAECKTRPDVAAQLRLLDQGARAGRT